MQSQQSLNFKLIPHFWFNKRVDHTYGVLHKKCKWHDTLFKLVEENPPMIIHIIPKICHMLKVFSLILLENLFQVNWRHSSYIRNMERKSMLKKQKQEK